MNLLIAQLTSLILLFGGSFLIGILPVLCFKCGSFTHQSERGRRKASSAASYFLSFSGGVLLTVALLQLLPRARYEFAASHASESINITGNNSGHSHHHSSESSSGHHHQHSIPLAEFTVGCGFFLAYVLDLILHALLDRPKASPLEQFSRTVRDRFCSCSMRNIECSRPYKHKPVGPHPAALSERRRRSATWDGALMAPRRSEEKTQILSPPDILQSSFILHPNYGSVIEPVMPPEPQSPLECQHGRLIQGEGGITLTTRAVAVPPHLPNIPEGELPASDRWSTSPISVAGILLVLALAIPSIIEGMAIGYQREPEGTWMVLLTTSIQKLAMSFVLGLVVFFDDSKICLTVACVALFSSMAPCGIAVAMLLEGEGFGVFPCTAAGVMDSLAAGTLLYVIFYDLWPKKAWSPVCSHRRFTVKLLGVVIMAALLYLVILF